MTDRPAWANSLPEYRSHKIVQAAPIAAFNGDDGRGGEIVTLVVDRYESRTIRAALAGDTFARGRPKVGDFIVVYDEGHVSWSPRGAFEAGYSPLTAEP